MPSSVCHKYAPQLSPEETNQKLSAPIAPRKHPYQRRSYLLNERLERLRQRQSNILKCNLSRLASPRQRTHVVRLRRRDLLRNLRFPCPARCLGLLDARVGEVGVEPGYVFVAGLEGPVALHTHKTWFIRDVLDFCGIEGEGKGNVHPTLQFRIRPLRHCDIPRHVGLGIITGS